MKVMKSSKQMKEAKYGHDQERNEGMAWCELT